MAREHINPHSERMIHWMRLCFKRKADEIIQWCDMFAPEYGMHTGSFKIWLKYRTGAFYKISNNETEGFRLR